MEHLNTFYKNYKFPTTAILWCSIVISLIFGGLAFWITDRSFISDNFDVVCNNFHHIISLLKKMSKHDFSDDEKREFNSRIEEVKNEIHEVKGGIRSDIDKVLKDINEVKPGDSDSKNLIDTIERDLGLLEEDIINKESMKWYVGFYVLTLTFFLFFFVLYPCIYYAADSLTSSEDLVKAFEKL